MVENVGGDPLIPFLCIPCYNEDTNFSLDLGVLGAYGHEHCTSCFIKLDASGIKKYRCLECGDNYCNIYLIIKYSYSYINC